MGTDIHMITQVQDPSGVWRTVPGVAFHDRNYNTFAQLAGVRNGRGFAGCDLGAGFIPITEPRGLPEDVSKWLEGESDGGDDALGDHNHSWLLLSELLAYDTTQTTILRGIISISQYRAWDRVSQPDSWCGGTSGPGVRVGYPEDADGGNVTHVRVAWVLTYHDAAYRFWSGFVPKLQALGDPDRVRIVFGFDS